MRVFCINEMRHCDGHLEEVRFVEFPYEKHGESAEIPVGSEKVNIWKEPFLTPCGVIYVWATEQYDLLKSAGD
ncbi:hypothetical protein NB640_08310 [Oxalobacter vibrioformis]|uniref:Uncharacterized protein n=1 Tax=Oxalobacter vibrioformis TaxID=933080 RepID=A0A9E9P1W9_9BURK|nr:hypothetical protein [Oxalobacter vibrioformis]NLC22914.1 hypothetical protein [Oxalobacter sp.]WAW09269.1 hypothetical protein NB640_08310 [Oxalobacter vibrioformis]